MSALVFWVALWLALSWLVFLAAQSAAALVHWVAHCLA
jgi:hypothetical protein